MPHIAMLDAANHLSKAMERLLRGYIVPDGPISLKDNTLSVDWSTSTPPQAQVAYRRMSICLEDLREAIDHEEGKRNE